MTLKIRTAKEVDDMLLIIRDNLYKPSVISMMFEYDDIADLYTIFLEVDETFVEEEA